MVARLFFIPAPGGGDHPHMMFNGKEHLVWSLNNYLGLANHPEVREADAQAAADYGMAYPMGARMMSGNTNSSRRTGKQPGRICRQGCSLFAKLRLPGHGIYN
jgi:7-keto-8-aminopelargonate synthetase-like enzyme